MKPLKKTGYIPGLDGWRAVSIVGVLAAHCHAFNIAGHSFSPSAGPGWLGVYIFFAISGFLITTRILEEEDVLGRVNLKGFYLRRIFRIQPAALVYLGVVALLTLAGCVAQLWKYWFGAIFFFTNYLGQLDTAHIYQGVLTGPFWTLAVEEHFYLLLSLFLFFVPRHRARLLVLLYLACMSWTAFCLFHWHGAQSKEVMRHTFVQLQFLIPASVFAIALRRPAFAARARHWLRPWAVIWIPLSCTMLSIGLRKVLGPAWLGAHRAVSHVLIPDWSWLYIELFLFWILATTLHPQSTTTRLLELPPLRWIGRLSYSLYLWHALSFFGAYISTGAVSTKVFAFLSHTPVMLAAAFAMACASFYLVERPMMRLGHRLAPPATPGRTDMQDEPSIEAAVENSSLAY